MTNIISLKAQIPIINSMAVSGNDHPQTFFYKVAKQIHGDRLETIPVDDINLWGIYSNDFKMLVWDKLQHVQVIHSVPRTTPVKDPTTGVVKRFYSKHPHTRRLYSCADMKKLLLSEFNKMLDKLE